MAGTVNQAALAVAGRAAIGATFRSPEERLRIVIQAYVDAVDAQSFYMVTAADGTQQEQPRNYLFDDDRQRAEYAAKVAKEKSQSKGPAPEKVR